MGCRAAEGKREGEKGWAERGPCGREEGKGGPREREGVRAAGLSVLSSSFLFLFHTQTIQTILFEFK
jgi:hypothetical protein